MQVDTNIDTRACTSVLGQTMSQRVPENNENIVGSNAA